MYSNFSKTLNSIFSPSSDHEKMIKSSLDSNVSIFISLTLMDERLLAFFSLETFDDIVTTSDQKLMFL
jgi:hypothetical protein